MSALFKSIEARFESLTPELLEALLQVEQETYAQPWTRGNFQDALRSGYQIQLLMADDNLLGYFVAMLGVEEAHLLNLTVTPKYQHQGWSWVMLDAMDVWARGQGAQWFWLEVRANNLRAMAVYQRHGYGHVGQRKNYYPAGDGQREDAVVMSLRL